MGVYIPNVTIPKDGYIEIEIYANGDVRQYLKDADCGQAIAIHAPHGSLIDADKFLDHYNMKAIEECQNTDSYFVGVLDVLRDMQATIECEAVIEAEE